MLKHRCISQVHFSTPSKVAPGLPAEAESVEAKSPILTVKDQIQLVSHDYLSLGHSLDQ